jgi:sigma-B regulation protein RsbU (phosphoserine phosphatase)
VKILLVDDDPVARSIHSALLRLHGHEVVEAADGEAAWQMMQAGQISFVVSDWMMPNLAGVDLCRRIRAAAFEHYVYVILCTAKGEKSDLIEGMDAGADDFLVKPIGAEELRVKVRAGERVLSLEHGLADKNRELAGINSRLQSAYALIQEDLKAAAWMQERLLPPAALASHGVRCEGRLQPSGYIAGDIFNFFPLDEEHIGFYLLDVAGHGVPAAMLSVTLSMVLAPDQMQGSPLRRYDYVADTSEAMPPGDVIRELNRRFQAKDDRYFTMVYGLIDTRSQRLRIAQAGHPSPVLLRRDGQREILGTGGMPVGLWPEMEFDCIETFFYQGDRLLLYSDGVTECMNDAGEGFGEARLLQYLDREREQPMDKMLTGLLAEIGERHEGKEFNDDISLLTIEMA